MARLVLIALILAAIAGLGYMLVRGLGRVVERVRASGEREIDLMGGNTMRWLAYVVLIALIAVVSVNSIGAGPT
ncbi:hypothetical protein FDP22_02020 [Paroceanicella profunda]|uniref:Uncharacterized protein n=1 Tax=Paroceanicella profunda TaxID=2579971 RepID=A0A5B8FG43_9RHOB|nr:hypothetical protein [Paroceanicella profunda]QDL90667.1 hypothetical protein FDP22_02020 [Paroceanicella profunda]